MTDKPSSSLLTAAKLFTTTSARGQEYLRGRMGALSVLVMPNRNFLEGDPVNGHSHVLMLGEAAPYVPRAQNGSAPSETPRWEGQIAARSYVQKPDDRFRKRAGGGPKTQLQDDVVPFGPEVR